MKEYIHQFFKDHSGIRFAMIGNRNHQEFLDLSPFGISGAFEGEAFFDSYYRANKRAFEGNLKLPGWVFTDLYLLPGAVGVLLRDDEVVAGYYAAPSLTPGLFIGVSLFSFPGGGATLKALTLKSYGAKRLQGVSPFSAKAIRSHVKLGPLEILGPPPGPHENGESSFLYECALWQESPECKSRIPIDELENLKRGIICAPGVDDDGAVCFA